MFTKVLIAEDYALMNEGIKNALKEMKIPEVDSTQSCELAFQKIHNAREKKQPYQLLVTDLHFGAQSKIPHLKDGFDLIKSISEHRYKIPVLVLSVEKNPLKIQSLIDKYKIAGYILKSEKDKEECHKAIQKIFKKRNLPYLPKEVKQLLSNSNVLELTEFDLAVLGLIAKGYRQKEIPLYLKEHNYNKTSLRSVEGRLEELRQIFNVSNNAQLLLTLKDLGLL